MDCKHRLYLFSNRIWYDTRNDSAFAVFLPHQNTDFTRNVTHSKSSTSSLLSCVTWNSAYISYLIVCVCSCTENTHCFVITTTRSQTFSRIKAVTIILLTNPESRDFSSDLFKMFKITWLNDDLIGRMSLAGLPKDTVVSVGYQVININP